MRWVPVVVALACASCGDDILPVGTPLVSARDLTIIAHQDDDLLFMQPDLLDAMRSGRGVTNVYVTAGNGTKGVAVAEQRDLGLRAAYAAATGYALKDWDCGWIEIDEHPAEHCRLADARVSLVFLNYPDGGKLGEQPDSLLHLWEGQIDSATTIAREPTTYNQKTLIATIAAIVTATKPEHVRTLDIASTHGRDHIDHMVVGALALLGMAQAGSSAVLTSFRGYGVEDEQADTDAALVARSQNIVQHYDACVDGCATCGQACAPADFDPAHATWLGRRYAVGFRAPLAAGRVAYADLGQCLSSDNDGSVRLVDCNSPPAQEWQLTATGAIADGSACIQMLPTGELDAAPCDPTAVPPANEHWYFDDEGHLWSGVAPIPVGSGMDYAHLDCLVVGTSGGKVHTDLCGQGESPTWLWLRGGGNTLAPTLAGARVAIGDVDGDGHGDLAVIAANALDVYAGSGDATFAVTPVVVGPLAVDAASLALGDLDGDGRADACGRDADGVLCLLGSAQVRWTESLSSGAGVEPALAIVGGEVCGATADGFTCATRGEVGVAQASLPAGAIGSWGPDLDGDGLADACAVAAAGSGMACVLYADRALTTDVAPWAFSLGGVEDIAAGTTALTAFADLDGDGFADECDVDTAGNRVACARSGAHGLGPRFTALDTLPPSGAAQLVLGDLDGDGGADICTLDAGGNVTCALSP